MSLITSKFPAHGGLQQPGDAARALKAGHDALASGREEEALRMLAPLARKHSADPRLWQMIGLLHRSLEDLEPAIAAFRKAAQLAPRDPGIVHGLARVHLEAGLPSLDLFRAAQRLAREDANVLLGLAAALLAEIGPEIAIEALDAVLLRHPGWLAGQSALCRLRWQAGDRERFTASLDRALADHPRDIALWRALIIILTQGELYERTLAVIRSGRAAAGDHLLFDANEAVCRAELREFEEADRLFARIADTVDATVSVQQVRHLLRTGRPAEAAQLAEPFARSDPQSHMFWPYLAVAWRLTGDPRWEWLEGDSRFVGVYDLADKLPSLGGLAERLRLLHKFREQPLEQSVRGGTQTDGPLLSRIEPEIRALRKAIVSAVEQHVAQLPPPDPLHPLLAHPRNRRIRFSGSWSVRLLAQGHHANHIHPAGWLSSALYVAVPGDEERGPAPSGWLSLGQPQAQLGVDVPATQLVEPKPGRLVLFPSTMWHGTVPFPAGERLTVAFDIARPR